MLFASTDKIINLPMPLMFMPKKSALIILLVLGIICLVDGIVKRDIKELLVALGILGYVIVSLLTGKKKNPVNKNEREHHNTINPN